MTAVAAALHPYLAPAEAQAAPDPPRRRYDPVLMGDILTARCNDPVLLIRWRAAEAEATDRG